VFAILALIAIFTIPAFGEKVSMNIVGDDVLQINQTNPLIRADVLIEKYNPQNGNYFMRVIDQSTGEILKDSQIFLQDRQDRVWSTQIAHISQVETIGEYKILVYSEFGSVNASAFYSVVETKDLPSESTPESILKEFQGQKDSDDLHFIGKFGEVVDCEFIDYKVTGTILPYAELPIAIEIVNPEGKVVGSESFTLESSTFQKNIKVDDWSVSGIYLIHLTYKYLIYEEEFEPNIKFPTDKEISDCRFKQSVEEQIKSAGELVMQTDVETEVEQTDVEVETVQTNVEAEMAQTDVEIENLGETVSEFVHESRNLFKQQREETRAQIKECRESVRNAESSEREELRKQCRSDLKEIRDSYKELRHVYHETFKEFRDSMKILIKENRGIAIGENERASAIEDIENRAKMSDKREKIRELHEQMREEIAEDRKQLREQHNQEREEMREKMKMSRDEMGSEMDSEERRAELEAMKEEQEQMREKHDADREQMKAERDAAKAERDAERDAEEEERENEDN